MDLESEVNTFPTSSEEVTNERTETSDKTETQLTSLLGDLGLEQYYKEKLSLRKILQIDGKTISDEPASTQSDLPWYFLSKLMMANGTARKMTCTSECESDCDGATGSSAFNFDDLFDSPNSGDKLNPLDIITALFLCSDAFVQQEMALKMSMCQFSVPLLLPDCDTQQCTLLLWALRDIVKKYRPPSLSQSMGFIEERIVLSELPLISFVRLGECSLSKSEILNQLLSNSEQYHNTFVHHNMECGDCPRRISDGLTEITWYLPCGNRNIDIFSEPVAVANLRGDAASFETQFSFLCHTSAAVFVFFDNLDFDSKLLTDQPHKEQIFLVGNSQSSSFSKNALKTVATKMGLTSSNIIIKTKQQNEAHFIKNLREKVRDVVENPKVKMQIAQMADTAMELGIKVDENCPDCQAAKKSADSITENIQNTSEYKEDQLPLQGEIWKELTELEKEECKLRKVGSENIETYKSRLHLQKKELRKKQSSCDISAAMASFIAAISNSGKQRYYFLKWMRINLDNLSREKLSVLREQYKKKFKRSHNKDEIKSIDRELSNSSLGTEHFFREMGQIYEAAVSLPKTDPSRHQVEHLPKICAGLLLDGFPLELVDGDASNIPLRWVSDVLSSLNDLVSPKNKILVVTVLGVQSTGKSTLLNTMFGVQFAVSSGRCTRGAFMLLIRINDEMKEELNCDFMVIIDTEGLKSPELAQLDNSYKHDNELATLVVGLSDLTIINIAMENSTEMKDIMQIVVHAFLRMKMLGKKHQCQFVHQNVSDVSAHEKNLRDRKLLLEQLNEMTQAAAKMENKEENTSFTDVMEYSPDTGNWYIPALWNGNPPMAPVNAGYSEAVFELRKNIIKLLRKCGSSSQCVLDFKEWMSSLWNAVKHEDFIFSFRNSLVADAYVKLCTEFNKWEWEFKKDMYKWVTNAETKISNHGSVGVNNETSDLEEFVTNLKSEACTVLSKWEDTLLGNLTEYFKQKVGHANLVEGHKQDFANSAKSLRREMENSVLKQLTVTADMKQRMTDLDCRKEKYREQLKERVCDLIERCRKRKVQMDDKELDREFDMMWSKMLTELSFSEPNVTDVFASVSHALRKNLSSRGSHASELLSQKKLQDCGWEPFKYRVEGALQALKNLAGKLNIIEDEVKTLQNMADAIIAYCKEFVVTKVQSKSNYHDTYIQEILRMIDERLQNNQNVKIKVEFEVPLKQHICGYVARCFQKMHEDFLLVNDPKRCLSQNKVKFCTDFKDVFKKRDQEVGRCQKKAEEFTEVLKPAVRQFVYSSLGPDIIDEMLKKQMFSTRMSCMYSILLDLLAKDNFEKYLSYTTSYEEYVKKWTLINIEACFSNGSKMSDFEARLIQSKIDSINDAIDKAKLKSSAEKKDGEEMKIFVEDICKELKDKLVISQDKLGDFMFLNNVNQEQFAHCLPDAVEEMGEALQEEFKKTDFQKKLESVSVKTQNELFTKVMGCGKVCPFCAVPCEAGGEAHKEHFSSLHRPKGLGRYRWDLTEKLCTDICSSSVNSETRFRCAATKNEWHPYKKYREIFPDWRIPPDVSLEASDYWKYIMTKYNQKFAKAYNAEPADIPPNWKEITPEQAEASLKKSFYMK
ncbi:up-regulator of cell proliferation [Echeneis naucrates]|uniref:VLIG-type G domain-containing protein n=1 Tax=Echeneis naucrates TaxID=173247 RepID=A0A665VHN2_ECHNA|nr:up-regulator of cell proliferation [Echeneis naucrates]